MRDPNFTEDRLYWAAVKRFTLLLEDESDIDPKIVAEIVKFLDKIDLSAMNITSLSDDDPAAVRAKELAAQLNK